MYLNTGGFPPLQVRVNLGHRGSTRGPKMPTAIATSAAIAAVARDQLRYWQMNFRSSMKMS